MMSWTRYEFIRDHQKSFASFSAATYTGFMAGVAQRGSNAPYVAAGSYQNAWNFQTGRGAYTGSFDNRPSDEYPVPKSSMATRMPALLNSRSLRLAPSTSCNSPVSVISRSRP